MSTRSRPALLACAAGLLLTVSRGALAGDTLYSFTDEAGVTHISNVPADDRYRPLRGGENQRVVRAARDDSVQPLAPALPPEEEQPPPPPRQSSDR